jgi:hypothetical protein
MSRHQIQVSAVFGPLSSDFGIAVAEAMGHGLPVITTYGAPWKLVEQERCGWWVCPGEHGCA